MVVRVCEFNVGTSIRNHLCKLSLCVVLVMSALNYGSAVI